MDYSIVVSEILHRRRFGQKPGIEVCRELIEKLGHPEKNLRIIHIAGTNGKGSVAHYTAGALTLSGHHTGLFTSPHLRDFRERIRLDGEMISREAVMELYERIAALGGEPTMFDITFIMAVLYFMERGCEFAVMETGLGGRLDATSAVQKSPEVCAITSIGMDHTDVLGNTIGEIAFEKAGIIKRDSHVVIGPMADAPAEVIADHAKKVGAASVVRVAMSESEISLVKNRAICEEILRLLDIPAEALDSVPPLPGRLYPISEDPLFLIDGAHNPQAASDLLRSLGHFYPGKRFIFLIGALEGHDTGEFISRLLPMAEELYTVGIADKRAKSAGELKALAESLGARAVECEDTASAVKLVREAAIKSGCPAVACGSFYLIGEILDEIQFTP